MTRTEIVSILEERNLRPLRQLGQNFLFDSNMCQWLVSTATEGLQQGAKVLEIGPGLGAITEHFLQNGFKLTAMEKDRGLAAFLREKYAANPNFTLLEGDALDLIPQLTENLTLVAGNLPYNISTPLVMALLGWETPCGRLFFTVQKEMAERLAAQPRTKDYGAVTVLVQSEYETRIVRTIPNTVFYPQPDVESAAILLTRKKELPVSAGNRSAFREFVKKGFSQRRKKLSNLLPVKDQRRAEELSIEDWVVLFNQCI